MHIASFSLSLRQPSSPSLTAKPVDIARKNGLSAETGLHLPSSPVSDQPLPFRPGMETVSATVLGSRSILEPPSIAARPGVMPKFHPLLRHGIPTRLFGGSRCRRGIPARRRRDMPRHSWPPRRLDVARCVLPRGRRRRGASAAAGGGAGMPLRRPQAGDAQHVSDNHGRHPASAAVP